MKVQELLVESVPAHNPSPEYRAALATHAKDLFDTLMNPDKTSTLEVQVLVNEGRTKVDR